MWGCGAAQIFSAVSSAMHEEFSLKYEIEWMSRFGLNYYGCCEPLDKKIDILKKIPRLRKISMNSWVDLESAAEKVGGDYVFSYKPNPAIFAEDLWDIRSVKKNLAEDFKKLEKCNTEIILKDISTVKYQPERLWQWAKAAVEMSEEYS